jgi:3-deoxy-D-manno-octulosonic-acid transferase
VKVAAAVIPALRRRLPGCGVLLSTVTPHGRDLARQTFGKAVPIVYAPLDIVPFVRAALRSTRPHMLVFVETEIWPSWLVEARRAGVRIALANGRISQRSFARYARFAWFFRRVLAHVDAFSMISAADAARIRAMGAPADRISVSGNAKYDILRGQTSQGAEREMRELLGIRPGRPVIVAGSTREREEALILDAYALVRKQFPDTLLVLAPRHIRRASQLREMIEGRGLSCGMRSDPDRPLKTEERQVVILDTFGELFRVYSVASLAYCGGSLVPLGGQNPLEPASWGKPVLYGPHMENFLDAKSLLEEAGGGLEVQSPGDLAEQAIRLLQDPEAGAGMGDRARQAVLHHTGSAEKHAGVVARVWEGPTRAD